MQRILVSLIIGLLLLSVAGCGGGGDQNGEVTQQQQVAAGQSVYTAECAECHDPGGIGPVLDASNLAAYGTAQELYTYVHGAMPLDAPGSLTDQQYYDVTAYMISDAGLLPQDVVIGPDTLGTVNLR